MILAHGQLSLFECTIRFRYQIPNFFLDNLGIVGHLNQFRGQHFALAVQDLVAFLRKAQLLLHT